MRRRGPRRGLLSDSLLVTAAALSAWLLPAAGAHALAPPARSSAGHARAPVAAPRHALDQPTLDATVANIPAGQPMAPGFVGLSLEYSAMHIYTGRDPRAVNPVLVQLLRALTPGQAPILRIGGDSADTTWWPMKGVIPPGGIKYAVTDGWLRTTRALASALGARLIMDLNLASGRPALAAAEARAFLQRLSHRYLKTFEIGNEPDVYGSFVYYRDRRGRAFFARGRNYDLSALRSEFSRWVAALPAIPIAGPALAALTWLSGLDRFISSEPRLALVTIHRYPLRACIRDPTSPGYPSIPNLLSDRSSADLARGVAPYVAVAHARGLPFRIDELNSASCSGKPGVSDTFASALWMLDTLFNMASVGVDGVNVHTLPGASYEPFTFSQKRGARHAFVHPEYYGMLMFAQAFPPGAQLLPVSIASGPVKAWATRSPDGRTRVVLINKNTGSAATVRVQLPNTAGAATLGRLIAPSASATKGVTLDGQTFGTKTSVGRLPGAPRLESVPSVLGAYSIDLPPASAALLTQ